MGLLFRVLIFTDQGIVMSNRRQRHSALVQQFQPEQRPSGSSWVGWHSRRSVHVSRWLMKFEEAMRDLRREVSLSVEAEQAKPMRQSRDVQNVNKRSSEEPVILI